MQVQPLRELQLPATLEMDLLCDHVVLLLGSSEGDFEANLHAGPSTVVLVTAPGWF